MPATAAPRRRTAPRGGPKVDPLAQVRVLKRLYPGARCSLDYETPFQLLVATILSAQCTDERVNQVTPGLFRQLPTPRDFADVPAGELETAIRSTGFFRSKARSLRECARDLVEKHGSEVPRTLEELTALRGVGRKTANVVLGNAYGIPGVVVDTHVSRLSHRLGLTRQRDPEKIERDLMEKIPKRDWTLFSHLLIHHGRAICQARKPRCPECKLAPLCPKIGVPAAIRSTAPAFVPPVGSAPKAKRAAR
jgi:endonuclease-3